MHTVIGKYYFYTKLKTERRMFSLKFLFACKSVKTQFLISAKLLIFLFDYQFAQDNSYSAELLSFKFPPNLEPGQLEVSNLEYSG